MRYAKPTGDEALFTPAPGTSHTLPGERFTRHFVTVDATLVILLAFAFGFGNGWATALRLGVSPWIAPLAQPAVDLAVVGLMIALRYLAIHGWTDEQLRKPRWWLRFFGCLTLAMNTALPAGEHHFSRAAWDAIGPVLLIAWSELAPWLLRAIYSVRAEQAAVAANTQEDELPETEAQESSPPVMQIVQPTATVTDIRDMALADIARDFMIKWDADGKRYADGVIRSLHELLDSQGREVTRRRVGQVCQAGWDQLHEEGRVTAPRAS